MVRSMAPVVSMAQMASMALVGNLDLARIRHHQARRSTPNTPNILSVLRRNRSLVTDPVSDQDMDQTRVQDTGRIMGQALVDSPVVNPVAGVSQNKRRRSGQIREQTIRHAAHATRSTPARSKQSRRIHSAEEPHGVIPTRPKVARCASSS